MALAEVLRHLRGMAGITQEDFAKATGYGRPSIANIEAGRQTVSLGQLFAFARVLNMKPEKIVSGTSAATRRPAAKGWRLLRLEQRQSAALDSRCRRGEGDSQLVDR